VHKKELLSLWLFPKKGSQITDLPRSTLEVKMLYTQEHLESSSLPHPPLPSSRPDRPIPAATLKSKNCPNHELNRI
jgi:hypothetical protein